MRVLMYRWLITRGWWCNCRHWACRVDTFCHALHIKWSWVCNKHDARILGGDSA